VLRSAATVIAVGAVAERAVEHGIGPDRIASDGGFVVREDVFSPEGPVLDLTRLRRDIESDPDLAPLMWGDLAPDRPYFGICGKLGETKGSFALLSAMQRLKHAGLEVGVVALSHGAPPVERAFRARVRRLGLGDRVLQIPFLPPWRVAEFLRGCLAVCCLEQDFSIRLHAPIISREVLLCGKCLVASTEVIRKLPGYGGLPHGFGCVAIEDVNDALVLSERLAAIARDPAPAGIVGARGRGFASELQQDMAFPATLERILERAADVSRRPPAASEAAAPTRASAEQDDFPLSRLASGALAGNGASVQAFASPSMDLTDACDVKAELERRIAAGQTGLQALAAAVQIEISIAEAEQPAPQGDETRAIDPLFRLNIGRWALAEGAVADLVPVRDPQVRVIEVPYDVSEFIDVRTVADLPAVPTRSPSYMVVFARDDGGRRMPLVVDAATAKILRLSDGMRTAGDILRLLAKDARVPGQDNIEWLEWLFAHGLIRLIERPRETPAVNRHGPLGEPLPEARATECNVQPKIDTN
jgi:hypothetical protein